MERNNNNTPLDVELARAFFTRLREKGFDVRENLGAYGGVGGEVVFELYGDTAAKEGPFCEIDFHGDGSFYRIAGFTSGFWQDEVDWKKY